MAKACKVVSEPTVILSANANLVTAEGAWAIQIRCGKGDPPNPGKALHNIIHDLPTSPIAGRIQLAETPK